MKGMRTTITLPDPVLENAKQRARERGITFSEFVAEAVQRASGKAVA